jgi:hypothetical protein
LSATCQDLRVCGDGLLFTDLNQHVLRGLHLKTGILGTFVGHPKQPLFRLGPLGFNVFRFRHPSVHQF